MKTHELARALTLLSRILKSGPNVDLKELDLSSHESIKKSGNADIELGLSTLVSLSRVDKQQWLSIIDDYGFPIEVRKRDASRDILGKLLRYLEKTPEARKRLADGAKEKSTQASPELLRALEVLIKD